jgi:hypothetical protein
LRQLGDRVNKRLKSPRTARGSGQLVGVVARPAKETT